MVVVVVFVIVNVVVVEFIVVVVIIVIIIFNALFLPPAAPFSGGVDAGAGEQQHDVAQQRQGAQNGRPVEGVERRR